MRVTRRNRPKNPVWFVYGARMATVWLGMWLAAGATAATPADLRGDVPGFEVCFLQLMVDNAGNPLAEVSGPFLCGERHIPLRQTCDLVGYLTLDSRNACKADDLVFWQAQVATRAALAIADGRSGVGVLHDEGLARCAQLAAGGTDPVDCLTEINWRTTMEFLAADLLADLIADVKETR